ncbi:hypothetical protein EIP91_005199 [Steccherinum ochraceum]|uniref:Uncharacterized protein n=1 Tax=Steccherinum ochraceum TaxID=92696 RepID=A0A4R0R7G8_9APHY|nr:hypothetical protein EIP91_005199 [Steccherinum ochraceum]
MSGDAAAAGDGCAALCLICCTESLLSWCNYKAYGGGSSTTSAGCCTSCCKRSFDEDQFEIEEQRQKADRERAAKNAEPDGVHSASQPPPQKEMSANGHGTVREQG